MAYLNDSHLNIDNNLVGNAICPVTLGRKNYLFAGTHDAAQRVARSIPSSQHARNLMGISMHG